MTAAVGTIHASARAFRTAIVRQQRLWVKKKKTGDYDCIIPVSGGKDSTWQVIMALEYGLKPLCVNSRTCDLSPLGRKNLDNEQIKEYVAGVKANGHEVMTDILLGLPGESKDQYISSMKKVIDYGFQRASVADIRLLSGSVMAEDDYRKKFGLVSRFRVIPSAYGEYGDEKVVEYEECIRKTSTMISMK